MLHSRDSSDHLTMQGVREKLSIPKPAQKPVTNKLEDLEGVNELLASQLVEDLPEFNVDLCGTRNK